MELWKFKSCLVDENTFDVGADGAKDMWTRIGSYP